MKSGTLLKVSYITIFAALNSFLNFLFQLVIAKTFGVGVITDTFFLAFSIPEWLLNITLFILPVTVIPVISGELAKGNEDKAWKIINSLITSITLLLGLIVVLVILFSDQIGEVIAANLPEQARRLFKHELVFLFPIVVFSTLSSIVMGVYYSYNKYFVPCIAPLLQSTIKIFGVVLFNRAFGIQSAAYSILIGTIAEFILLVLLLDRSRFALTIKLIDDDVRDILRLMLPLVIGNIILESEVIIDRYLASFLVVGSISYLYYASKITRVFATLTAKGIYTVFFPKLSKSHAINDDHSFQDSFEKSMNLVIFFMFVIIGLVLLSGRDIIFVIFHNQNFSMEDVVRTSTVLIAFCGVLVCFPLGDILNNIFYSRKDTRTPITINLILFAPGIGFKILFLNIWGYIGIALSSSLMNVLRICISLFYLKRKQPLLRFKKVIVNFFQNLISFGVSLVCIYLVRGLLSLEQLSHESLKIVVLLRIFIHFLLFSLLYTAANALVRNDLVKGLLSNYKMKRETK